MCSLEFFPGPQVQGRFLVKLYISLKLGAHIVLLTKAPVNLFLSIFWLIKRPWTVKLDVEPTLLIFRKKVILAGILTKVGPFPTRRRKLNKYQRSDFLPIIIIKIVYMMINLIYSIEIHTLNSFLNQEKFEISNLFSLWHLLNFFLHPDIFFLWNLWHNQHLQLCLK